MINTKVKVFDYTLKTPIIPASGTFGFGYEFSEYYDLNVLGSIALKGTTLSSRFGNPQPRIADCPAGLINAIGLQNPGAVAVRDIELNKLDKVYSGKVIANVCGHSFDEYVEVIKILNSSDKIFCYELNVSCPNVTEGGMTFGTDVNTLKSLVAKAKLAAKKPIIVKLTPNVTDITLLAKAAADGGADGLSLINTLVGMRIDLNTGKPIISANTGGYSGPGVFPVALAMVYKVYKSVNLPIIGMGGITNAYDIIEMMSAGASCVMIGTQNLVNPYACRDIAEDLPKIMEKLHIEDINEIIGRSAK